MKKVVFVISNLGIGGAQRMLAGLIQEIDQSRFDIELLCFSNKSNTGIETAIEKVCPITYINAPRMGVMSVIKLVCQLFRMKPDIVHAHMGSVSVAMVWSLLSRKKLIFTAHAAPEYALRKKNQILFGKLKRKINIITVAVSEKNAEKCRAFYDLNSEQCVCINNGVDLTRLYRVEHSGFTYINVATQNENKNQSLVLRCFKRLHELCPDTRLMLVGDGPMHDELMRQVEKLGLQDAVMFPGTVIDVEKYLAVSDCYIQSSHTEAMPMAVIEAMAAGLPVISTDVGGLRDIIHENGYLVSDGDDEGFLIAMEKMYNTTEMQRKLMSENSIKNVQNFSSKRMAEQYMTLYEKQE